MSNLPIYIDLLFIATVAATFILFLKTTYFSKKLLIILLSWMGAHPMLAFKGFYLDSNIFPPRFMFTIIPPIIVMILLFTTRKGRVWIDGLNIKWLTWIHIVRIPVELVLFLISLHHLVPTLMTFEGRNYDILSGITTPVIYYFTLRNNSNKKLLLFWNVVCLGLLFNITVLAILSAPSPYQKFAFDQPNKALYYFPFIWLSSVIVPLVLFSHLASIRKLVIEIRNEPQTLKGALNIEQGTRNVEL